MINRTKMPRQLRNKGGITSVISRKKYGIGSDIKDFVRDIIPNELADVAVKVAPIVAPFYPGYAAIARGLGRFDQRGSISDALKQGAATYGFGKVAGKLGGAEGSEMGNVFGRQKYSMEGFKERGLGRLFKGGEKKLSDADKLKRAKSIENTPEFMKTATEATIGKVPLLDKLPPMVQQKLLVGGVTAGASALYSYFTGEFEPQEPGETMGEYMARRNQRVKEQMRGYMDSYYTPLRNPQYAAMSDEEKNNFIDSIVGQQNDAMMATGGRVGYQVGGISSLNTLAENIARNRANQAAFQQYIAPAQEKTRQTIASRVNQAINPSQETVLQRMQNVQNAPSALETLGNLYNKKGIDEAQSKYIDQAVASTPTLKKQMSQVKDLMSGSGFVSDLRHKTAAAQLRDTLGGGITGQVAANVLGGIREIPQLLTGDFKGVGEDLKANFQGARDVPVGLTPQESYDYLIAQQQVDPGVAATPTPDAGTDRPTMADVAGPSQDDKIYINSEGTVTEKPNYIPGTPYNYRGDVLHLGDDPAANTPYMRKRYPKSLLKPTMADVAGPATTGAGYAGDTKNVVSEDPLGLIQQINKLRNGQLPTANYSYQPEEGGYVAWDGTSYTVVSPDQIKMDIEALQAQGLKEGGMPTGIMRSNQAGVMERDYRDKGGFVPVGIKEKADDVPAMLSKNEFVFTADAVRGAGNGSIEKGAQKMYDTMKNLERRVV